jgi:septin family protein
MDQRAEVESFLAHKPKATKEIKSLNVEIIASISERLLLTVIDTPGLEFSSGRELVLEQQTNGIIREIDKRYAETLIEENKVVRSSKGDQHVHLCVGQLFLQLISSCFDYQVYLSD